MQSAPEKRTDDVILLVEGILNVTTDRQKYLAEIATQMMLDLVVQEMLLRGYGTEAPSFSGLESFFQKNVNDPTCE